MSSYISILFWHFTLNVRVGLILGEGEKFVLLNPTQNKLIPCHCDWYFKLRKKQKKTFLCQWETYVSQSFKVYEI